MASWTRTRCALPSDWRSGPKWHKMLWQKSQKVALVLGVNRVASNHPLFTQAVHLIGGISQDLTQNFVGVLAQQGGR